MNNKMPVSDVLKKAEIEIPGWTPFDQLLALYSLTIASNSLGGDVLEVGSWCGRSAIALGLGAHVSSGKVHCVDLFPEKDDWFKNEDGTYSFLVNIHGFNYYGCRGQTVWSEPFHNQIMPIYDKFVGTMQWIEDSAKRFDLEDKLIPFRGDLPRFAESKADGLSLRLAFLDGEHSTEALVKDIEIVEKYILPGGWLCFDDAFTSYEDVDRSIRNLEASGKYKCCHQITRKMFLLQRIV